MVVLRRVHGHVIIPRTGKVVINHASHIHEKGPYWLLENSMGFNLCYPFPSFVREVPPGPCWMAVFAVTSFMWAINK